MTHIDTALTRIDRATRSALTAIAALQSEIDAAAELARSMKAAAERLAGRQAATRIDDVHPGDPDLVLPGAIRPRDTIESGIRTAAASLRRNTNGPSSNGEAA